MSWYASVPKLALAAGVLLLGAGCSEREKVAIAAKDSEIRKQNDLIAQENADRDRMHAIIEKNQAVIEKEQAEKKQLSKANEDLAKQADDLIKVNAGTSAQLAAQGKELSEMRQIVERVDKEMATVKAGQGVPDGQKSAVSQEASGAIHITVASSALFDSGKADLKPSTHEMLKKVAHMLKTKYAHNYVRIEGHTDGTPVVLNKAKYPDNMALSIARARAVYEYLIKDGGLSSGRLYTAGYGEHQPLVHPEKTAADRAKNRRVEIVIMPENVKVQKDQLAAATTTHTNK